MLILMAQQNLMTNAKWGNWQFWHWNIISAITLCMTGTTQGVRIRGGFKEKFNADVLKNTDDRKNEDELKKEEEELKKEDHLKYEDDLK